MPPARSQVLLFIVLASLLALLATFVSALALRPSWPAGVTLTLLLAIGYARLSLTASGSLLGLASGNRQPDRPGVPAPGRTALLLPIYNEVLGPIAAAVGIMAEALEPADDVAIFILSDTQDPGQVAAEAEMFPVRSTARSGVAVHYRRRPANIGRKAGNIGEFCRHAGLAFDFAIVLDADSLMTADAIRALIASMRADPQAGLIQSVTYPAGGSTLFARTQQFAARLSTPLTVAGQHVWQGRSGTFWGHNAIFRIAAFAAHAELPVLSGRPPLGGEVLCHDTIEAALLLRAGWAVHTALAITGSYETTPSNLVDHLARERRWCQGNMQHLRLIGTPRWRAESRLHILIGILHYLSAPAGLSLSAFLLVGSSAGYRIHTHLLAVSAALTMLLLFGPKLVSIGRALARPGAARGFGGRLRLLASSLLEQAASMLTAPILTLSVTGFVVATFAGRVVAWEAPARGDREITWREAWRRFGWHTVIGVTAALAALALRPAALPFLSPFLLGLVVSVPLAVCSGSIRLGALSRRLGLFLTEDELMPTAELAALQGLATVRQHASGPGQVRPTPRIRLPARSAPG